MGKKPPPPEPPFWEQPVTAYLGLESSYGLNELAVFELGLLVAFFGALVAVRAYGNRTPMLTSATLNMRSLNRVNIFKECFLGYVNAGMLEPLLALSSGEYDITAKSAIINACQLLGLFSWLYLLTDAFDFTDTQQSFVYWSRVLGKPGRPADKTRAALAKLPAGLPPSTVPPKPRIIGKNTFDRIVAPPPSPSKIPPPPGSPQGRAADLAGSAGGRAAESSLFKKHSIVPTKADGTKLPGWLKVHGTAANESDGLRGSFTADLSLWFMLACSFAAVCGVVSHRDVIHSHAVIILWVILHHMTRAATAWRGTGYLHTLFTPSAALLPLEYCLNLTDQEMVGDDGLDDLAEWREFIERETGVKLTIVV